MNKFLILLITAFTTSASQIPNSFYGLSLGMNNVTYTELESTLTDEDGATSKKTQANGSVSIISLTVDYHMPIKRNQLIYVRGLTPLIANADRMFSGGTGYQYFFGNALVSDIEIHSVDGSYVHFSPTFRYYVGGGADVSYLFYTSKTSKKTDLLFQIGPQAGILYRWKKKIDIKAQAEFQIGYGSVVSTSSMKILSGLTYQF